MEKYLLFIPDWGTLVVAVIALVQPWLIGLWRRFLRRQKVDVYETAAIEIGFSDLGPTVGLQGTIRAIHRDAFVKEIELSVVRKSDDSKHRFNWGVFRSNEFSPNRTPSAAHCAGFLLSESAPFRYNIQFWEYQMQERVQEILQGVREVWARGFLDAVGPDPVSHDASDAAEAGKRLQVLVEGLYNDFAHGPTHVEAYSALSRLFYWEPGAYSVELAIHTSDPERSYLENWQFSLSDSDAERIRLNIITALRTACGQNGSYNFAYVPYKDGAEG